MSPVFPIVMVTPGLAGLTQHLHQLPHSYERQQIVRANLPQSCQTSTRTLKQENDDASSITNWNRSPGEQGGFPKSHT